MTTLKQALEDLCKAIEGKWTDRGSTPPKELIGPLEMARHILDQDDADFDSLLYAKLGVDRCLNSAAAAEKNTPQLN